MTEGHDAVAAPPRLDWITVSDSLEAVFVAARRISALARHQAAEYARMRTCGDARKVREAWADANHLVDPAMGELQVAVDRLAAEASNILGLIMEAEDRAA